MHSLSAKVGKMDFDFIIVGAGSAGCVLANRLSMDPTNRVLLLEAGPKDNDFWIHVPMGFGKNINNSKVNWCYRGEPEPFCRDRSFLLPRGRVLGGSSSINGMVYVRGQVEDFDHWAQLGNRGWSYEDVLPYFKKSENNSRGPSRIHGVGGPVFVSDVSESNGLCDLLIKAAQEIGIPKNNDINGRIQEGVGYHQATINNGRRSSAATAYLNPIRKRSNLHIQTNALVAKVTFKGRRATSVIYKVDGDFREARANKNIVISAGTYNSPQILELSGIGKAERLKGLGIDVVHELPGVGHDMQDHHIVKLRWRITEPVTYNEQTHGWRAMQTVLRYLLFRRGVLSMPTTPISVFTRTRQELATPDLQIQVIPGTYEDFESRKLDADPGVTMGATMLRPESRGSVHIRSKDPHESPAIFNNLLGTEGDRQTAVLAARLCRRLMEAPAIKEIVGKELTPGSDVKSPEDLREAVRDMVQSNWHPTSTCRMGSDRLAVVDDSLKVRGLSGLRIADASIMPTVVSGNTNAASIMIGEKASDMILEEAKKGE